MNPLNKKVFLSFLSSILLATFFYFISFTKPFKQELYLNSFYGIFSCLIIIFFVSFFWIFTWWNLDKLQKEPLYAIIKSYFSPLIIYSFMMMIFNRGFIYSATECIEIISLVKFVLIPLFTLFLVFEFIIFRLPVFDEAVDCLIYGGFAGVGLGSALCIEELFSFQYVSLQYFIQFLIIRLMLCSAVCALCGWLLNRLRISSKFLSLIFPVIILFTVFSLHHIVDSLLQTNIKLAQINSLKFLFALLLSIILFFITILLISKTSKKDFTESSRNGLIFFRVYGVLLCLLLIINSVYIQKEQDKTILHYSSDKMWSYELPKDLSEVQTEGINSLFKKSSKRSFQKYTCSNYDIYISFNSSDNLSDAFNDETEIIKGWKLVQQDSKNCTSYQLKKDYDIVSIQIEKKNSKTNLDTKRIAKLIAKSLIKEAAYENK